MLQTLGRSFALMLLVCVVCFFVEVAATGCGGQPASTHWSTIHDDESTTPPGDADPDAEPQYDDGANDDTTSSDDVPSNSYCEAVADWAPTWAAFENEVLELVNRRRAAGADCGSAGTFGSVEALTMNTALRCAARSHSLDMGTRDYFDHYTPEGLGPGERLDEAGYSGSSWAENIAWGYATPEAVVSGWMSSPGHCANIMQAGFTETGIGYYERSLWTQTFGRP